MDPVKRYPKGPVTAHGWYHITHGTRPMMWLKAYDGSIHFDLLGGLAAPFHDPMQPDVVALKSLKGLISPWRHIDQKGASEDGITNLDSLYDPIEIEADFECVGADQKAILRVVSDLIASVDAKQTSELGWWTQELGYWWSDIRWFQGGMPVALQGVQELRQKMPMRLRADNGFWRGVDHNASFQFEYEAMTDSFTVDNTDTEDLGDIPQHYFGTGGGYCTSDGANMIWVDDPSDPFTTHDREVVNGPWPDFETDTDNMVVSQVHAGFQEWSVPESARNTLWARMNRDEDGEWAGSGVRLYYGIGWIRLSYFIDFEEVAVLRERPLIAPPLPTEKFTLVCGFEGDPRMFKVLRNGLEIMTVKESGTGSPLGADYRGAGNGMFAAAALISQATPSPIRKISAGDNASVTQYGWLEMKNVGDQPMYWDATLFGPFEKVKLYDGPGSDDYVEFGPLLDNQIVFLRTDPRSNTTLVQDLTQVPPTAQELNIFQDAVKQFLSHAGSDDDAFLNQIRSLWGIRPPQGNLYKYLNGRFSDNVAIPPKSPGNPVQPYHVKVEIVGGNADSKVLVAGTPLRRYPL